jgi:hypothetical protein
MKGIINRIFCSHSYEEIDFKFEQKPTSYYTSNLILIKKNKCTRCGKEKLEKQLIKDEDRDIYLPMVNQKGK